MDTEEAMEADGWQRARGPPKDFEPRSYQIKVFEVARQKNTIAVLETGAGKTMIAVMLITEFRRRLVENSEKMVIIFLAPTVFLVNQQCKVIRDQSEYDVEEYHGNKGIEEWSAEYWIKETSSREAQPNEERNGHNIWISLTVRWCHTQYNLMGVFVSLISGFALLKQRIIILKVMVMTPQILLDALRNAFLSLDMVHLMIFDECHRACGNHPYTKIMKEFYHKSGHKPAIFGMTASPVIRKGVSSAIDCEGQISALESILDCKVYSVEDRAEFEKFVPSANTVNSYYAANSFNFHDLKTKLESIRQKCDASMAILQESPSNQFKDTDDILKASRKRLSRYHGRILYCLEDLGLICAAEAAKVCIENVHVRHVEGECRFSRESFKLLISFLEEVLCAINEILPPECGYLEGIQLGFISPKLDTLVHISQSISSTKGALCLIFIERIIAAKVIDCFLKRVSKLSHFSISYLTGGSSSKESLTSQMQKTTLDLFRAGEVNFLLTTDVAEEGIHVPNCSCVIRFDLPKTVRSYVQSRGRARQIDSQYVLMIERGNVEQRDRLFDIIRSEYSMRNSVVCRGPTTSIPCMFCEAKDVYCVESTGATVSTDSSINLIYKYCEKLPKDRYFIPNPFFQFSENDGLYQCTLILPPNAALQRIVGPQSSSSHSAKQLVSLEACKRLHVLGALNDHLLPFLEEPMETDFSGKDEEYYSGAGTTKRKELHGMTRINALSGTWAYKPENVTLNAYKLNFVCDLEGENYSGFVLLIEAILDSDIASAEIELFLIPNKVVKSSVSPCGEVQLNADQVEKSKLFQEFFFNGIFGKLFTGSRSSGVQREFLFREGHKIPWSSSNMYLLLPLESSVTSCDTLSIHWRGIYECASVVEYLRNVYSLDGEYCSGSTASYSNAFEAMFNPSEIIHLANKSLHIQSLKDLVVLSLHTGKIYSVLDVINDVTPDCSFDEMYTTKPSEFASFIDYYFKKYNIVLKHPGQPLLLLKQSHNPHNLLFSKSRYEDGSTGQMTIVEKEQVHARIPPELLVHIDISTDILKAFYLLPSVMHRVESLMLASQLREQIDCGCSVTRISCSLILEAITTLSCCENFSLERLELLGDSVLKYAVSCHLFLNYPKKHEGQLSDRRSWAVCNSTLHKLGTTQSLQGYIRDCAFDSRRWVAPGQISLHPFPCICDVETHDVPIDRRYMTEDSHVVVGKACDKGHRWMCSKTIADCVEALVGAYYAGGGLSAAFSLMKWFGIDIKYDTKLVKEIKMTASQRYYISKADQIERLESKLNYRFTIKGLLVEAITHPSQQELGIDYCYQRLEFLGDSVLDFLITCHLFMSHKDINPGELTDLRSASVNNDNFAQVAVRHDLHRYIQHGCGRLLSRITEYINCISEYQGNDDMLLPVGTPKGPKVLADIVESIAGAVLIDSELNLETVWGLFKPLLSPIVTPDKLALPPLRELIELCDCLGYLISTTCTNKGEEVVAELAVQLNDDLLVQHGCDKNRKAAKAKAAFCLLKDLEKRGISHSRYVSKRLSCADDNHDISCHSITDVHIPTSLEESDMIEANHFKKQNEVRCSMQSELNSGKLNEPVILQVKMQKGGPRTSVFELCRTLRWPMPKFESKEERCRTPVILNGVKTPNFNIFTSHITMHIPNTSVIKLVGEQRTDKKSAHDSAAFVMLRELQKHNICIIKEA